MLCRPLHLTERHPAQLTYRWWYRYLILAFCWLGTTTSCIMLTHHTILLMAVPIMLTGQYRHSWKLVAATMLLAVACVLFGVYGGYFWGCFDSNLLHIGITAENFSDLALRVQLATPTRMHDLLTHYVAPRVLIVLALVLLASRVSRRNHERLHRQEQLQATVEAEMQRANDIQSHIINSLANLIENRDNSTGEHVKRTSFYVRCIVEQLRTDPSCRLTEREAEAIVAAAPLHDIGKIVVADRILQKPGRLTPEEYEEIKQHAAQGAAVIRNVLGHVENEDFLRIASDIAGGHHERWDGRGYPQALRGDRIPLSARIMAVADVFDALVSERVYKKPIPAEEAFRLIRQEAGHQFDPQVVRAFCDLRPKILAFLAAQGGQPEAVSKTSRV